jgi:RNA polymerase sigma-70 factor (ECF subfamily)
MSAFRKFFGKLTQPRHSMKRRSRPAAKRTAQLGVQQLEQRDMRPIPMPDPSMHTLELHRCVERWQAGDRAAADKLLRALGSRLEHLARKMLRGFPNVRGWAETVDVLQGSLVRLLNTLQNLRPESTRHFFNLAVVHLRRELLDLARQYAGDRFVRLTPAGPADESSAGLSQVAQAPAEGDDLDLWCRFHQAVDQLPAEEREVLGLVFYHGWTQVQIAELFQVDERTIRRRWQSACLRLNRLVRAQRHPTCPRPS